MWLRCQQDNRSSSAASALKECKPDKFPNIYIVLFLGCVLPVTTAECKRTGSVIRRLHSYTRATQGQERFSELA